MKKLNIAVIYGGKSPEHEVAIISALQAMHAIKAANHNVTPIYISKSGQWYLGNQDFLEPEFYQDLNNPTTEGQSCTLLPTNPTKLLVKSTFGYKPSTQHFDAIFPIFHGNYGEDGSIQGLIKLFDLPIVGCQLGTSAVSIDKYICKRIVSNLGFNTVSDLLVTKDQWKEDQKGAIKLIHSNLGKQVFIKPNTLGSSIGLSKATDKKSLTNGLDVAFAYDQRVLVETALHPIKEINISIIGNNPYQLSSTEEPISSSDVLSFEDKYVGNAKKSGSKQSQGMASAKRIMPAKVSSKTIKQVENIATTIFSALNGKGLSRIDFMLKGSKLYFNEINTIPGSLSFYLWEKSGLSFPKLMDRLIQDAIQNHQDTAKLITTFDSNILSQYQSSSKLSKN